MVFEGFPIPNSQREKISDCERKIQVGGGFCQEILYLIRVFIYVYGVYWRDLRSLGFCVLHSYGRLVCSVEFFVIIVYLHMCISSRYIGFFFSCVFVWVFVIKSSIYYHTPHTIEILKSSLVHNVLTTAKKEHKVNNNAKKKRILDLHRLGYSNTNGGR